VLKTQNYPSFHWQRVRESNPCKIASFIGKLQFSLLQKSATLRKVSVMNSHEKPSSRKPTVVKVGNAVVKIYSGKSRGYDLFTVVHYVGGQRKRETFAKLTDAKERAREVARAMLNGRLEVLELTNSDREGYVYALQLLKPLGIPLHNAVEEYVAAHSHLGNESLLSAVKEYVARRRHVTDKRLPEIVDELLTAKKRDGLSNRYIETLRSHLKRFASAFQTSIGSVTARLIEEWLTTQNLGPRGRNNIRTSIVTLFHFARARGYLPKGQPTEAEDVTKAKDRGGKIGILTPKQLASLMKKAMGNVRLYFALGAFTGMRSSEILKLDWTDINFERGHITVSPDKAKTATRRLVPIQSNLAQWLAPYRGRTGRLFRSRRDADKAIAFAKEQGIKWPDNALRHSYATYRVAAVSDTARVALEMGNSPQKLMTNYRELADQHDATAWFSITPKPVKNVVQIAA
jgi:integrase